VLESAFGKDVDSALRAAAKASRRSVTVDGNAIEIACPFASPPDWRDQWIYFAMVDRFNNPDAPPNRQWDGPVGEFQGGTLEGVRQRLGYLERLGVGAIWLTPVLQNCAGQPGTYHGYGIQHFLRVDPRFASDRNDPDAEFRRLVDEAHARGMYVILDVVLNHAGDVFAYRFDDGTLAPKAPFRTEPYEIRWRGADSGPVGTWSSAPARGDPQLTDQAAIWPEELRTNPAFRRQGIGGEEGGDFESLKELVTARSEVRAALIRAYQYAVARWDVDGFRIDTLKFVERDFARVFGNAMREYALAIGKRNFFTFGEVFDREEKIAAFIGRNTTEGHDLVGVDAALDFPLFWALPPVIKGMAPPTAVSDVFDHRRQVQQHIVSSHGQTSGYFVTFLDNHDMKSRLRFVDRDQPTRFDGQVTAALACLFALQGIPCVYYGTEQGLSGQGDSDSHVREALWGRPDAFDESSTFYRALRDIARVRAGCPALRYGRQYFRPLSGDRQTFGMSGFTPGVLAFSRILNEDEIVVVANATASQVDVSILIDATLNPVGAEFTTLYSSLGSTAQAKVEESQAQVIGGGPPGRIRSIRITPGPGEARILARA
jgi:glycosidase